MKFTVDRDALRDALAAVAPVIATKTTLPVLGNVLITAAPNRVQLNATDLDLAVSVSVAADVDKPGDATLPAKRLLEIAKQLPEDTVRVSAAAQGHYAVECGKARYKLVGLPSDEFPTFPAVDFTKGSTLPAGTVQQMIARVAFAASTSDNRPTLRGVLWELRPDRMTMVATNGHRLAKLDRPMTGGDTADVIVPPKALDLVCRLFPADAEITVARTASHIGFGDGTTFVLSRLIEGPYPNYQQVVPKGNDRSVVLDRAAFAAAVRRVAVVAGKELNRIKLSRTASGLKISAQSPDVGSASEDVAGAWTGEPIEIGVNAAYLLDALRHVPTAEVLMTFKAPERAMTLGTSGWNDPATWLAIIMPLRLVD